MFSHLIFPWGDALEFWAFVVLRGWDICGSSTHVVRYVMMLSMRECLQAKLLIRIRLMWHTTVVNMCFMLWTGFDRRIGLFPVLGS